MLRQYMPPGATLFGFERAMAIYWRHERRKSASEARLLMSGDISWRRRAQRRHGGGDGWRYCRHLSDMPVTPRLQRERHIMPKLRYFSKTCSGH